MEKRLLNGCMFVFTPLKLAVMKYKEVAVCDSNAILLSNRFSLVAL